MRRKTTSASDWLPNKGGIILPCLVCSLPLGDGVESGWPDSTQNGSGTQAKSVVDSCFFFLLPVSLSKVFQRHSELQKAQQQNNLNPCGAEPLSQAQSYSSMTQTDVSSPEEPASQNHNHNIPPGEPASQNHDHIISPGEPASHNQNHTISPGEC